MCKYCHEPIRKSTGVFRDWVHVATDNVFCANNLPGLTARFAVPS
jgi:hypothetical protein